MVKRRRLPSDWEEQCREAYDDYGHAVGRMLMWKHVSEDEIWDLVGGTEVWPRWYLTAFARLYRRENPREYWRQQNGARRARQINRKGKELKADRNKLLDELASKNQNQE